MISNVYVVAIQYINAEAVICGQTARCNACSPERNMTDKAQVTLHNYNPREKGYMHFQKSSKTHNGSSSKSWCSTYRAHSDTSPKHYPNRSSGLRRHLPHFHITSCSRCRWSRHLSNAWETIQSRFVAVCLGLEVYISTNRNTDSQNENLPHVMHIIITPATHRYTWLLKY